MSGAGREAAVSSPGTRAQWYLPEWVRMPLWARALVMFVAYALAAELSNMLSVQNAFSTFWPPAGVALVLLALSPPKEWPVLLAAMAVANVSSDLLHGRPVAVALGFALANASEASLGAYLARRFVGRPPRLLTRRHAVAFGLWCGCVAPALGATVGATVVRVAFGGAWLTTWATWWTGDAVGLLVVGGFGLALADFVDRHHRGDAPRRSLKAIAGYAVLFVTTVGLGGLVAGYLGPMSGWKFAVALPVGLAASIFGTIGAATLGLGLAISTTAALALATGRVTLASGGLSADVLVLQAFLAVISFTALFLATAVEEARASVAAQRVLTEKYRILLETLPIGVTISDAGGAIIETSRHAQEILRVPGEAHRRRDIDGVEWTLVGLDGMTLPRAEWVSVRALAEGHQVRDQQGVLLPDGTTAWLDITAAPIPLEGYGVAIAYVDITAELEAQARLRASEGRLTEMAAGLQAEVAAQTDQLLRTNEALVAASSAKSRFLANMSHELRTPLNSIIGFAGVLGQGMAGPLNEEQAREVDMIRRSGDHLLALVNDILDLERIEEGAPEAVVSEFAIAGLLRDVVSTMRPLAKDKGVRLTVACPAEARITSDRGKLEQVLLNLVGNAVKFTDEGEVTLTCTFEKERVLLAVRDTGLGIPSEELPRVMEDFHQVERLDGMKPEGTGLGLAISRRLVALLGGSISIESTPGLGSTFTVQLPLDPGGH
jgi:signal transduction histidine kinase